MQAVPLGYTPWVAEGAASPAINTAGRDEQRGGDGVWRQENRIEKLKKTQTVLVVALSLSPIAFLSL